MLFRSLYVLLYTAGRFWIEALRIDRVNEIGGFRLNNYTALIGFIVALVWLIWLIRNRPGREEVVEGIGLPRVSSGEESDMVDSNGPETAAGADMADRAAAAADTADDEDTAGQASTKDPTATP